jgi:hypothetical protein
MNRSTAQPVRNSSAGQPQRTELDCLRPASSVSHDEDRGTESPLGVTLDRRAPSRSVIGARAARTARTVKAARARARVACAASLLRWIYFMAVHDAGWDPVAASGGRLSPDEPPAAA